jgi:ferredoxin
MRSRTAPLRSAREKAPAAKGPRLRIDPGVCDGVGICAHLAPDVVTLDSWGDPILSIEALSRGGDRRQAEAAVAACPRKALYLEG